MSFALTSNSLAVSRLQLQGPSLLQACDGNTRCLCGSLTAAEKSILSVCSGEITPDCFRQVLELRVFPSQTRKLLHRRHPVVDHAFLSWYEASRIGAQRRSRAIIANRYSY